MPNLRIRHLGMGWPVGAIVPPAAFPGGPAGHLALAAVEATDEPATHGLDLPVPPPVGSEAAENAALRARVVGLEGKLAGAADEARKLTAEVARLRQENAELHDLLDQATAATVARATAVEQARLSSGPIGPSAA